MSVGSAAKLAGLAALWLLSVQVAADLTASVNREVIGETDTLELTVKASGANIDGSPDFTVLENNFRVLGTQTSSQFRSVNGRAEAWTVWTVALEPKRTGSLRIPSFQVGGQRSTPLTVTVKALDGDTRRAIDEIVFFETDYQPEAVYVQAQLVFTRRLFYAEGAQLYGDMPDTPSVPDAVVQPLGDPRPFTLTREGRRYGVIEQRYAIFPEQSGTLVIPGASVTGSVHLPRRLGFSTRTGVRVTAEAVEITVRPVPESFPGDAVWLPAAHVEIRETFEPTDPPQFDVGRPVTRALAIRATGVVASIIPPLDLAYPAALKTYAEPPSLQDGATSSGVVGTRTERQSLVVTQPGHLELPTIALPWWDTNTDTLRIASVPPRSFAVTGVAPTPPRQPVAAAPAEPSMPTTQVAAPSDEQDVHVNLNPALVIVAAIALLGWAITWRRARRTPHRADTAGASDLAASETRAYRALKQASAKGDPHTVRRALDAWLVARYGAPKTAALARFSRSEQARTALDDLNRVLFASTPPSSVDFSKVMQAVEAARSTADQHASSALPALYPTARESGLAR